MTRQSAIPSPQNFPQEHVTWFRFWLVRITPLKMGPRIKGETFESLEALVLDRDSMSGRRYCLAVEHAIPQSHYDDDL